MAGFRREFGLRDCSCAEPSAEWKDFLGGNASDRVPLIRQRDQAFDKRKNVV